MKEYKRYAIVELSIEAENAKDATGISSETLHDITCYGISDKRGKCDVSSVCSVGKAWLRDKVRNGFSVYCHFPSRLNEWLYKRFATDEMKARRKENRKRRIK